MKELFFWLDTECSSAGQFNSITRRNRRSIEHSYPEDKPASFGYATSIFSVYNNSIPEDDNGALSLSNSRKNVLPPAEEDHEGSDKQDERIEGLEAIVAKMQRTIKV